MNVHNDSSCNARATNYPHIYSWQLFRPKVVGDIKNTAKEQQPKAEIALKDTETYTFLFSLVLFKPFCDYLLLLL